LGSSNKARVVRLAGVGGRVSTVILSESDYCHLKLILSPEPTSPPPTTSLLMWLFHRTVWLETVRSYDAVAE
jgi:hypothetical protein